MIKTIAVVGGGISGALTVLNCIKQSKAQLHIIWFDAQNKFCKGFAYSTLDEQHLLNVRASNMSLFADEPNHFVNWLTKFYSNYSGKDFVPRKLFGNYVAHTFENLLITNSLVIIQQIAEEVVAIDKINDEFELKTTQVYKAQQLVLALGNFLPAHPKSISTEFLSSENYFQNAFHFSLVKRASTKKKITIIGSGLTMIDVLVSLHHNNYAGKITIISPHAYIPQAHNENPLPSVAPFIEENKVYSLMELFALVNQQLKVAVKNNLNPHSVIDVMRPHLQFIWLNFPLADKQQFLRHLRHKWGVARHRVPSQSMTIFNQMRSLGLLNLVKGRISDIKAVNDAFEIKYSNSKNEYPMIATELIINCTGPQSNYLNIPSVLVQNLIKNDFILPDSINYGINADGNGQISTNIYTIGPPLKGILWESTAVPEIRLQARDLAAKIICN